MFVAGAGFLITNAYATTPSPWGLRAGIGLIAVGILGMILAVLHQCGLRFRSPVFVRDSHTASPVRDELPAKPGMIASVFEPVLNKLRLMEGRINDRFAKLEDRIGPAAPPARPSVQWLLDLHDMGAHMILNRPISPEHLGRLEKDSETWTGIVASALRSYGATAVEINKFTTLESAEPIISGNSIGGDHQLTLNIMHTRLKLLRQISERLQG